MKNTSTLIAGIEYKLRKLIDKNESLKKELQQNIQYIEELKLLTDNQHHRIIELENNINLLKIAKSLEPGKGTVEAKVKINELVREIDRCIGLLNK
jgi:predicted RNase H-like nuclease (RuvC/YqgF family)